MMVGGGRERLRLFTDNSRPEPEPRPLPAVSTKQSGNIIQQRWKMRQSGWRHACIVVIPELWSLQDGKSGGFRTRYCC